MRANFGTNRQLAVSFAYAECNDGQRATVSNYRGQWVVTVARTTRKLNFKGAQQ